MDDDLKPDAGATPDAPAPDDKPAADDAVAAQAQNPDAVKRALQAERDAAKAARRELEAANARIREFEDRDKTDAEKLSERATAAEKAAADALARLARMEVAFEMKVPATLADRLRGETKDELMADAEALMAALAPKPAADEGDAKPPAGSFDGGARTPTPKKSLQERIQDATAKGDWATVSALNSELLMQLAGKA